MPQMQKKEIRAALLLALTIFSISFFATERFHDCAGEGCPICLLLNISEQNTKLLSLALIILAAVGGRQLEKIFRDLILCKPALKSNTLVSQKIKLNV